MTKAAIQGDYCDLKFIKTRKVAVISIEIPIEAATAFVAAFGTPNPATGVPVAIARLTEEPKPKKAPGVDVVQDAAEFMEWITEKPAKPKRSWDQLSRAEQAGIAGNDIEFRRYLTRNYAGNAIMDQDQAAQEVRNICGVNTRTMLDKDLTAGARWDKLYSDYQMWKRGAAA